MSFGKHLKLTYDHTFTRAVTREEVQSIELILQLLPDATDEELAGVLSLPLAAVQGVTGE